MRERCAMEGKEGRRGHESSCADTVEARGGGRAGSTCVAVKMKTSGAPALPRRSTATPSVGVGARAEGAAGDWPSEPLSDTSASRSTAAYACPPVHSSDASKLKPQRTRRYSAIVCKHSVIASQQELCGCLARNRVFA